MIHPAATLTAVEIHREAAARPPAEIVIRPGDSLSGIAARYHIEWPGLYEANRAVIGGNPNLLVPGEHLRIPSAATAARLAASYQPPAATVTVVPSAAPVTEPVAEQAAYSEPGGSFQQCVISRESGGDAQVMNGSGHYGLYQFSYSAWVAAGGNPADFGNASVAEQNQVFATAYAEDGTSPWAPYDGC
jgi:Tfp pilus assembly protein FimV